MTRGSHKISVREVKRMIRKVVEEQGELQKELESKKTISNALNAYDSILKTC